MCNLHAVSVAVCKSGSRSFHEIRWNWLKYIGERRHGSCKEKFAEEKKNDAKL
jgi:hypothetical protein